MSSKHHGKNGSGERFRFYMIEMLAVFAILVIMITTLIDYVILERTEQTIRREVSGLIDINSRQMELNINSYLERMETAPALLFSDELYYLYDATDPDIEAYDKIKTEETIRNRILDIGLMDNYADFAVVYTDDHKVGWISHGTQDMFKDGGLYDGFAAKIGNNRTKDGWCFGIGGNYDRIYYVKRLNPDAILVSSIYTRELSSVFIYPDEIRGLVVRLLDEEGCIIYSSDTEEIGKQLPDDIKSLLRTPEEVKNISERIATEDYIINANLCSNGWHVMTSVPTETILEENDALRRFTIRASVILAGILILMGLLLLIRIGRPMGGMVSSLQNKAEIDRLSGVMNKSTFQDEVEKRIPEGNGEDILVFVMIDMDNFKQINDNLGHIYGDQVIIRQGKLLRGFYDENTVIGRMGGDEFALFTECRDVSEAEIREAVSERMDQVMELFNREFEFEMKDYTLSISSGVYITRRKDTDFTEMYERADLALYRAKRNGKAQYCFYGEDADERV